MEPSQSLTTRPFEPQDLDQAVFLSKMLAKSTLLPPEIKNEADVFMIGITGHDLGLTFTQAIRGIYVVKGRPSLSSDLMISLVYQSGKAEYVHLVESSDQLATYETKRKGSPAPVSISYTIEMAKRAGLTGGETWKKHTEDMLRHRCASKLARAVYPDVIMGFHTPEELAETSTPTITVTQSPTIETAEPETGEDILGELDRVLEEVG